MKREEKRKAFEEIASLIEGVLEQWQEDQHDVSQEAARYASTAVSSFAWKHAGYNGNIVV